MRHVRQALLIIVVVMAMYLIPGYLGSLLGLRLPAISYEALIWSDRLMSSVSAAIAGAVLMRLISWRFRLLAMLAIPVLVLLVVPFVAYLRARSIFQYDISYVTMWPYYVYLGIPVAGMIIGALLMGWAAARRATDPGSAGTP
jgi:hypothetical protein